MRSYAGGVLRFALLALAGLVLAAALAVAVFFASEAALRSDESPLEPRGPAPSLTERTTTPSTAKPVPTVRTQTSPAATTGTETDDDGGRGRGRGRGRSGGDGGGNSGSGGGSDDD